MRAMRLKSAHTKTALLKSGAGNMVGIRQKGLLARPYSEISSSVSSIRGSSGKIFPAFSK